MCSQSHERQSKTTHRNDLKGTILLDLVVQKDSTSFAGLYLTNHISLEGKLHRFNDIGGDSGSSEWSEDKVSVECRERTGRREQNSLDVDERSILKTKD